jgi:hypothetical protein
MILRSKQMFCLICILSATTTAAGLDNKGGVQKALDSQNLRADAQPTSVAVDLPVLTAQQIVERNIAARGGGAAWQRINSVTLSGKLDAGKARKDGGNIGVADRKLARLQAKAQLRQAMYDKGGDDADKIIQLPFQLNMKRPFKTRLEIQFQGLTAVQIYDGTNGWKLRPYLGRHEVEPFTPEEMKIAASQQPLDGPLIDYVAKGTKVEFDGAESVEGRNAYRLRLTLKNGDVRRLWVDADSFLEVKMEGAPRRLDGRMHATATAFRDYRIVDGLKFPYTLETSVDGYKDKERIIISTVVVNPVLDEVRFSRPE